MKVERIDNKEIYCFIMNTDKTTMNFGNCSINRMCISMFSQTIYFHLYNSLIMFRIDHKRRNCFFVAHHFVRHTVNQKHLRTVLSKWMSEQNFRINSYHRGNVRLLMYINDGQSNI
jgi:gamma-glutamyl-gamma-aminobutyrate hydrolase PuuD